MKKLLLTAVGGAVLAAAITGVLYFQSHQQSEVCDPSTVGLPADAPPEFVAVFSYECASHYPNVSRDERINFASNFQYPSLLFDLLPEQDVLDSIQFVIQFGDRGFFSHDPNILDELIARSLAYELGDVISFVRTAYDSEKTFEQGTVNDAFLSALPLWNNPENSERLKNWCSRNNCSMTRTVCGEKVGLADKLALARGELNYQQLYEQCPMSTYWVQALSRAGLVDTRCPSSLQFSRENRFPGTLVLPCYPPGSSLSEHGYNASTLPRFWRQRRAEGAPLSAMTISNFKWMAEYYSEIENFLIKYK